jgi:hypothetical protein
MRFSVENGKLLFAYRGRLFRSGRPGNGAVVAV